MNLKLRRAAARAVQGRSAQARRRARPAARDGVSPSVPGPGPGRAHPRRSDEASTPICCARPITSSSKSCASTICTTSTSQAFAVFLPVNSVGVMGDGRALRLGDRAARGRDHRLHDRALGAPAVRVPGPRLPPHHQRSARHLARRLRHLRQAAGDDRVGVTLLSHFRILEFSAVPQRTICRLGDT